MDYFSKWPEVYAMKDQKVDTIMNCLIDVFTTHGVPQVLLSDQGGNFESYMIKELCQALGIDKRRTTPLHPQGDGLVERYNRTLTDMLSMYVNQNQSDWDYWLPQVVFAYRSSIHSTTGFSPFDIVYGRKAVLPDDIQYELVKSKDGDYNDSLKQRLSDIKEKVYKRTLAAKRTQKKQYDKSINFESYEVGNRVRFYNPNHKPGLSAKLTHRWSKAVTVIEKISELLYNLVDEETGKHKIIHFNRLKKCETPDENKKESEALTSPNVTEDQFTKPQTNVSASPEVRTAYDNSSSESNTEEIDNDEGTEVDNSTDGDARPVTTRTTHTVPYNLRTDRKQTQKFQVKH